MLNVNVQNFLKQRWKYLLKDDVDGDDNELKKAIANSLKELDPKVRDNSNDIHEKLFGFFFFQNPWVVDRKGRHTNLVTLLDEWPELEMEMDSGLIACDDGRVEK